MLRPHVDLVWDLGAVAVGASISKVHVLRTARSTATRSASSSTSTATSASFPAERLGEPTLGGGRAGLGFDRDPVHRRRLPHARRQDAQRRHAVAANDQHRSAFAPSTPSAATPIWGLEANRRDPRRASAATPNTSARPASKARRCATCSPSARARPSAWPAAAASRPAAGCSSRAASTASSGSATTSASRSRAAYADAPDGNFRAPQASIGLVWALDGPATQRAGGTAGAHRLQRRRRALRRAAQRRQRARARHGRAQARSLPRRRTSTSPARCWPRPAAAPSGYTSALVGAGWMQPLGSRLHVGAELLAGAGGGGGVDRRRRARRGARLRRRAAHAGARPARWRRAASRRSTARSNSNVFDLSLTLAYGVSSGD